MSGNHPRRGGHSGATSAARTATVDAEEADRRLDNYLATRLKGVPRSHIYRIIRSGEVRVNSRRAAASQRLQTGDRIRIPPLRLGRDAVRQSLDAKDADWILARILHEDDQLLVLDKPSGLAVHGGSGISLGAIELLRVARPEARFLELVHRLDKDTSGCLLVAKRPASLRHLQAQFRARTVGKSYLALLSGRLRGQQRTVDAPLLTTARRGGERHVRVAAQGKQAVTRFEVEERLPGATLARIALLTGRTHQIRVHAAHLGLPLAGDSRYGLKPDPVVEKAGLDRLFLHAAAISMASPDDGRPLNVESPLPAGLRTVLERLRAGRA